MLRSNLGARHFKPTLAKAGLPREVRLYDLRHTFDTLWVESGEDLKALQEILGHSRYETTANRYVHPSRPQRGDGPLRPALHTALLSPPIPRSSTPRGKDRRHAYLAYSEKASVCGDSREARLEGFEPPTRGLGNRCSIP